jgi:1-deoxy-D-xylulose-5-phosphate reductoisomerase
MGNRITIDSATMMNKGFEVIEAVHLFGVDIDSVEVVIHRESIIHSMVEYIDSAVIAEMGVPDMKLCIQYALTYPERVNGPVSPLDFSSLTSLSIGRPDHNAFPLLSLAYRAYKKGGVAPAMMNGADEEAVALFLKGRISFTDIFDFVTRVTEKAPKIADPTLSDIEEADMEARIRVRELSL